MLSCPSLTRKFLSCGLTLAAVTLALAGCDRQSGQNAQPAATGGATEPAPTIDRSHKGSQLPKLTFHDAAGRDINTATLTGKPLVINLWATWCAPCVAELPTLDVLAGKGDIRVLTVSQDTRGPEKIAAFLTAKGLGHLAGWLDPDGTAATQYQVTTLPASIYYDAQGHEVWRMTGGHDWTGATAAKLLAEAKP